MNRNHLFCPFSHWFASKCLHLLSWVVHAVDFDVFPFVFCLQCGVEGNSVTHTTASHTFLSLRRPSWYLTNQLGEAYSGAVFNNRGKNEKILKEAIPPQQLSGERNSAAMQFIVAELAACGAPAFERERWWEQMVWGRQWESWNLTNKGLSPLNPPHLKGERHGLKTLLPHTRSESVWSVLDNFINPGKCNQMESNSELLLPSGR